MKKKVIFISVFALLLILPSVVAVVSYLYAQDHPVSRAAVSEIVMTTPDGNEHRFLKERDAEIFSTFFAMNEQADEVPSLLSAVNDYTLYEVSFESYNKITTYSYYLTQDPSNGFYRNEKGEIYHISSEAVGGFLKTPYATPLFPQAVQPTLTVADCENLLPQQVTWKYLGYQGEYLDSDVSASAEVLSCDVSGGLQISFDRTPDYMFVTLKNAEGEVVFEDLHEKLDSSLFTTNTVYRVTLNARWYQAEDRNNYGEATYEFVANVLSPAVFYMSENAEIRYGDFVILSAKNIVDPTQIGFRSEPALDFEPTFFEYGGYYHALVPLSLALETTNDGALDYCFTLTYGDVSQELELHLTERQIKSVYYDSYSAELITSKRNETTLAAFEQTMKSILLAEEDTIYWAKDPMLIDPTTRAIHTGFGLNVILSATGTTYQHEGVNYKVYTGDTVMSCLPGKVVFVGDTVLSGTTVVVEHGGGLKSMYAHLSGTSVRVGDVIEKGHVVGVVGNTGFTAGTALHFGLYVYNVPVRYYNYENDGVSFAEPVMKALGLLSGDTE